jgi:hypothetical protein
MVQTRAAQISPRQIGARKIRMIKNGIAEIGRSEIGAVQPRMHQICAREVSGFEICFRQGGETQKRILQTRRLEVNRSTINSAQLALAQRQSGVR